MGRWRLFCFGVLVWCFVFAFWVSVLVLLVLFFPSLCSVSFPSMMTWAHRPHGVRTRGKKLPPKPAEKGFVWEPSVRRE